MQISEVIVLGLIGAVGTYVLTMVARDRLRKRRTVRSLATRVQHDDEGFARFWHPDPKQADIAIRARRVLARNLEMPLKGLKPSDRLKEDLNAELEINPHLFWDLEEEFAIKTGIDDLENFEKTLQRLITSEDLVKFLEERISTTPPNEPAEEDDEKLSRPYQWATRAVPVLCVAGLGTVLVGAFIQKEAMLGLGGMILLSGFAVWAFGHGGELLRGMIQSYKGKSWKEFAAHPWWLMFQLILLLFFFWMGWLLTRVILKGLFR